MYPVIANRIKTIYSCGLNKGFSSKFYVGSRVWQEIPEEGQSTHWSKCCEYNIKDEDNHPNTLNDKNNNF